MIFRPISSLIKWINYMGKNTVSVEVFDMTKKRLEMDIDMLKARIILLEGQLSK